MIDNPLTSLSDYSRFVAELLSQPNIKTSTVAVWSDSPYTSVAEGEVFFTNGLRLRLREEVDLDAGLIISYGYEVYRGEERLYWYDDFPHPNDPKLASTMPHHKHVPPDIKHNRIPAASLSFERPNLPAIIQEIEEIDGS
ncbi:MAG: hypothetical protein QOH71_1962 [Blastocatellia bacterium]|jgi:hypothetical protein|nr:hypothetical protein [Blastocatellia bacterium]